MITIIKTNNPVTLSFAQSVLNDSRIGSFVADQNISILEGSIGVLAKRLMVLADDEFAARRALKLAGLGKELYEA